jgi:hypothetical protein
MAALMERTDLDRRLQLYTDRNDLAVERQLGFGIHGTVFSMTHNTNGGRSAVKVHERGRDYARERDVYLRLRENGIGVIRGCDVPKLIASDDELWVIEMSIVKRPFVLDFAGAFLDQAPDFSEEVMAEWEAEKLEQFGARWRDVRAILRDLEGLGIFLIDVNPGNISFGD